MPHMEMLAARAALQAAFLCHFLAPADAAGYPVHLMKRLVEGDQTSAETDIRPVPVHVVDMAKPAEVLDLLFTLDILQVSAAPENLTTLAVAATSRSLLFLALLNGSVSGPRLGTDGAPDGNSAKSLGAKRMPAPRQCTGKDRLVETRRVERARQVIGGGRVLVARQ